ncbi:hypothetical protein SAMN05216326_10664 [Nitrosomonas marina]|uniref:Uncharacterized protein n=1 Tax=Nitrosomonas marina TaxID=917 RepID=A0A1I0A801_9PROT|nr:hypothetical protein SAMN05216326_10664 [Nitrosomonas marina]
MNKEYSVENNNDDIADGLVPDSRIVEIINKIELAKNEHDNYESCSLSRNCNLRTIRAETDHFKQRHKGTYTQGSSLSINLFSTFVVILLSDTLVCWVRF